MNLLVSGLKVLNDVFEVIVCVLVRIVLCLKLKFGKWVVVGVVRIWVLIMFVLMLF